MSEAVKPISNRKQWVQWSLVGVLAAIVAIAALPSYFSGQWPWSTPLEVPQISELRELKRTPLALRDWEIAVNQQVNISGSPWNLTEYVTPTETAAASGNIAPNFGLLLHPQDDHGKQPEVEWVDIRGSQGWDVSQRQSLTFSTTNANGEPVSVTARFFRGVSPERTFAVMQWYAWPTGGHSAPGKWFWADQARQWGQQERMPWVAVSVLLPIEPVGDIRPHRETAIAIGQAVQTRLLETVFAPVPSVE